MTKTKTSAGNRTAGVARFVGPHRRAGEPLDAMALRLGVSGIVEESLSFEGGIFELPGGELVIKLNADSPATRKRFTLAHEIGHLLLGKPGLRSSCGRDQVLERECDAIASELLMPMDEVAPFIKSLGKPSPEKLRAIASRFEVSLQAAAFRAHRDLALWKCFIGCWQRHPQIKTDWFVGYGRRWDRAQPDEHSLDLALSSNGPVQTKELWQRGPQAEPVWLNLLRLGTTGRVLGLVGFVN
ncbi:MAG: ImmA/IrrE family metallo-endopeptidase [Candidatus Acidiferrales bacterium]